MTLAEAKALLAAESPSDGDLATLARTLHAGSLIVEGLEPRHKSRVLKLAALASPSTFTGKAANESEAASAAREVHRLLRKHKATLRDRVAADDPPPKKRRPPPRRPAEPPPADYEPVVTVHPSHSYNGAQSSVSSRTMPPVMASVQCGGGGGVSGTVGSATVASPFMHFVKPAV